MAVKKGFPSAEMISAGEVKHGVIAQTPNYTSHENGRPGYSFAQMMENRAESLSQDAIYGLEELGWASPLLQDDLPAPNRHKKVAW